MSDFTIGDSFFTPILYNNYPEFMCTMINKCESTKDEFSLLKLVVTNKDLIDVYKEKVKQHNANFKEKVYILSKSHYYVLCTFGISFFFFWLRKKLFFFFLSKLDNIYNILNISIYTLYRISTVYRITNY